SAGTYWAKVSRARAWATDDSAPGAGGSGAAAIWVAGAGGTMVGRLVSKTTRSGSFWADWMRTVDLSIPGALWLAVAAACGTRASTAYNAANSAPPTYRK